MEAQNELSFEEIKQQLQSISPHSVTASVTESQLTAFKKVLEDSHSPYHQKAQGQSHTITNIGDKISQAPVYKILKQTTEGNPIQWSEDAIKLQNYIRIVLKYSNPLPYLTEIIEILSNKSLLYHLSKKSFVALTVGLK